MATKRCNICGNSVELPQKASVGAFVSCPNCSARAPLRVKKRSGNVRGLKGGFLPLHVWRWNEVCRR